MAGKASRVNGRKGGRPIGNNTLTAEVTRELIAAQLQPHIPKIVSALVKKAEKGDIQAARELLDRAYGRPQQSIDQRTTVSPFDIRAMVAESRKRYGGGIKD